MACEVNSRPWVEASTIIDSMIRGYLACLQRCLGELHQRSAVMLSGMHVMHAAFTILITILWPFGSGSEAEIYTVLNRVKKPQARNCDMHSELKRNALKA